MEKFTTYKVVPIKGWNTGYYVQNTFEGMLEQVNDLLYRQGEGVKVIAIVANPSVKFTPTREALISLFDILNRDKWKFGEPVEVVRKGATLADLEEISHYVDGIPREYYEKHPLWE